MNGTKRLTDKLGWVLCALLGAVLAWMLTGCTSYQDQPRARGGYYEDQPSPGVAYVAATQEETSYEGVRADSDFYEPLSPYGRWEVVDSYGRCWIPSGVASDWSPYSNGYWQDTDAGWYWASDEPWGWATYHYGRWDSSPQYGWYWVPQTQWAPAWVSWREGGGYVGWAPLGPSGRGGTPRGYVFVEERRFLEPVRLKTVIVNNTVINKTVINNGPGTTVIEQASGRKVQAVPVRQLRSKEEAKVVVKHPAPTSGKAVQASVRTQTELPVKKVVSVPEPRRVEKPVVTTAASPPPATKKEVQLPEQNRIAKLDDQNRVQQEKVRATQSEKVRPVPATVETRPTKTEVQHATKPEPKVESKPVAERPAPTQEPTERKAERDDEKKN